MGETKIVIDLNSYKSECEEHQKLIVCQDYGKCKYIADNRYEKSVAQYIIDGNVIKEGERCDFLLLNKTDLDVFFIEIKGSDIGKAIDQIARTEEVLKDSITGFETYYRIVYRTGTHDVNSSKVVNWKKKCGKIKNRDKAKISHMRMEEML